MNIARSSFLFLLLGGLFVIQASGHEQRPGHTELIAQNVLSPVPSPPNNTIRRINPNSRQGTVPATPSVTWPSTAPILRKPSIENGEIGNGYPRSRTPPEPIKPTAPSLQPRDKR